MRVIEDEEEDREKRFVERHSQYLAQTLVVFGSQVLLCSLLVHDFFDEEADSKINKMPSSVWIVSARFICCVILHMSLQDELRTGLSIMKFTLNHSYRFDDARIAFLSGFLQTVMIMVVETVNVMAILSASTVLDIVMNFMALAIISEFDDTFYGALGDEDEGKKVLVEENFKELLKITRTTSKEARAKCEGNKLKDDTYEFLQR